MAWKIERDLIALPDEESRVGYGEEHTRIPAIAIIALGAQSEPLPDKGEKVQFRLYDDDEQLYYEGWLHDDVECENQSAALKWAEYDSGCTIIKVQRRGVWTQEIA